MAYLVANDFRTATLAEYCQGLALTTAQASDTLLTNAIARFSTRVDDLTNDHFESASSVYTISGDGTTMLELPQRCTAVSQIRTRDFAGTWTVQSSSVYRLVSSLESGGAKRLSRDAIDYIQIIPGQVLSSVAAQGWPTDPASVEVTGTFGWTTTPGDIKRAVALMVWDHFLPEGNILRRATRVTTVDVSYDVLAVPPAAMEIINDYLRPEPLRVG